MTTADAAICQSAYDPISEIRIAGEVCIMSANSLEVEGLLERHHVWLFAKTDTDDRWRLNVYEPRVVGLLGLRVKVTGSSIGGTLKVEGVHRA